jgi:hypothetical protein
LTPAPYQDVAKRRRGQIFQFAVFIGLSALEIWALIRKPTFVTFGDWIILGGAILFPIMAAISFFDLDEGLVSRKG